MRFLERLEPRTLLAAVAGDAFSMGVDEVLIRHAEEGVLGNDEATAAELVEPPESGVLLLAEDGAFAYRPDAGFTGTDQFTYGDPAGGDPATVTIEILAPEPPVATLDPQIELAVEAGPTDLVVSLAVSAEPGLDGSVSLSLVATYDPTAGWGVESTLDAVFQSPLDPPADPAPPELAVPAVDQADEPAALSVDEDGALLAETPAGEKEVLAAPEHGRLLLGSQTGLMYVPDPDYHGPDRFAYAVRGEEHTATVEVRPVTDFSLGSRDLAERDALFALLFGDEGDEADEADDAGRYVDPILATLW